MKPATTFLWLRAETYLHVGAPGAGAIIDLPFAREAGTAYPYIPGSGLKGALRDTVRLVEDVEVTKDAAGADVFGDKKVVKDLFGTEENAGPVLVSDARLAFLPLRSLQAAYVLATCPALLDRLGRDLSFLGPLKRPSLESMPPAAPGDDSAMVADPTVFTAKELFLEEFRSPLADAETWQKWCAAIAPLVTGLENHADLLRRVVVMPDEDFGFFARRRLHVRMRNRLEIATKKVANGALWSEESLPPETLLYATLTERRAGSGTVTEVTNYLDQLGGCFQVGGNETVGEGWLRVANAKAEEG